MCPSCRNQSVDLLFKSRFNTSKFNTRVLLHSKPNLGLDLSYLVFYSRFCTFRIIPFYTVSLKKFLS